MAAVFAEPAPEQAIVRAIDSLREALRQRYGWTRVELEVELDHAREVVHVRGELVSRRIEPSLRARLDAAQPGPSWRVELELRTPSVVRWWAVPAAGLALWTEHPSLPRPKLATELVPADGPVGELACDRGAGAALVRARDGTLGWVTSPLVGAAAARPIAEPPALEPELGRRVYACARAWLGVPYRLGGATRRHIDCSALVQRALAKALGIVVPRNTRDQLAAAGGGEPALPAALERGALLYIHSRRMQRLHVGVCSGAGQILHASRTRDAVIEEPLAAFEADAAWVRHVGWIHLRSWARTQVGRAHIELPEHTCLPSP